MSQRERQVGLNETLFREINERLEELNKTFSEFTDKMELVCECGVRTCIERFPMDVRRVRAATRGPDDVRGQARPRAT